MFAHQSSTSGMRCLIAFGQSNFLSGCGKTKRLSGGHHDHPPGIVDGRVFGSGSMQDGQLNADDCSRHGLLGRDEAGLSPIW